MATQITLPRDAEGCEVANKLRASANVGGARTLKRELARVLSIQLDRYTPEASHTKILRGLADLIDRPTCHLDLTDVETNGNINVRCYECSECGRPCEEIYGKYERCPHCGAEVVDA